MRIGTISSKRQVYLSKSELDAIGVKPGQKVKVEDGEDESIMVSALEPDEPKPDTGVSKEKRT